MLGPTSLRLAFALVGLAGAVLAGCSDIPLVPARTVPVVIEGMAGVPPMKVDVEDGTGLVTAAAGSAMATSMDGFDAVFRAVPSLDRRDQLVILWAGGSCDAKIRMSIRSTGTDSVDVRVADVETQPECAGFVSVMRRLVLTFSRRMDGAHVTTRTPEPACFDVAGRETPCP